MFIAVLIVMGLTSCAAGESDPTEQTVTTLDMLTSTYGARSLSENGETGKNLRLEDLPLVSAEEADNILANLKKHTQSKKTYSIDSAIEDGMNEISIVMDETISNRYTFTLELNMEKDSNGTVYYKGYEAECSANTFIWYVKGFSFASDNTTGNNKFESPGYLYFKIADGKSFNYIQVSVIVKGTYNPTNNQAEFTYSI